MSDTPQTQKDSETSPPKQEWHLKLPLWLDLLLLVLVIILLFGGPIAASRWLNPWVGVILAALAIPAWMILGPRPFPGLLPGIIALNGFLILVGLLFKAIGDALRALRVGG